MHTATRCNSLRHTEHMATHCNTWQHTTAKHPWTNLEMSSKCQMTIPSKRTADTLLQHTATHHCSTPLQHTTATHISTSNRCLRMSDDNPLHTKSKHNRLVTHCNTLQHTAAHRCNTPLQLSFPQELDVSDCQIITFYCST